MTDTLLVALLGVSLASLGLGLALWLRKSTVDVAPLADRLAEQGQMARTESAQAARALREEVGAQLKAANDSLVQTLGTLGSKQQNQLDIFAGQLQRFTQDQAAAGQQLRLEIVAQLKAQTETIERRFEALRLTVEQQLKSLQEQNEKKLDAMRQTVDEKLHSTLEKRLGESFKLVSDRLEQVHKGLGEMQTLATGVGDLKKVLTNVKSRGTWGEVQLGNLLAQMLAPEQYEANVVTRPGSAERVEFAVRLPGKDARGGDVVYLPIDAKFPQEDYQRLVEAAEAADAAGVETALRQLENRIRGSAQDIHDKYINPPQTTDFAILFLPTEGLYAEVIRRAALVETVQRTCRVVIAGPTTLAALLNSLQMGFRTLAIEKRSSEVWQVLGAVKTEFGKFGEALSAVKDKLEQAASKIEATEVRTRQITKKLRQVEELSTESAQTLLGATDDDAAGEDPPARQNHA